jgi:large subunit ribosomal protein L29
MAKAKALELRDLPDAALVEKLVETRDELFKLRFTHMTGQLDNHSRLSELRRQVARVSTELRAREIAAHEALDAQTEETA